MSRYHKAAIDGYLDLLKEATRKDLNTPDEDGMTPTLWAAFHGHAEALQLICSRGGDPNRSDIWGNTPLHHAATNGHMHILSFLVNFGANLFSQDNDFHTAMDVAASRDRMDCVRFLDSAASQQTIQNAKKVARLKKEATKEAETRTGTINSVNEQFSKLIASDTSGSLTARSKGTLQRVFGKKDKGTTEKVGGDGNVIFVKQENGTLSGKPEFMGVFSEQDEIEEEEDQGIRRFGDDEVNDDDEGGDGPGAKESIFKRPGLGNMVFRKNFSMEMGIEPDDFPSGNNENLGFLIRREGFDTEGEDTGFVEDEEDSDLPWNQEEIGLDDDQDEETSPLDAFLSSISLPDFSPAFTREQLDLEALMLCSDNDLKGIRIQLGPRKKILEAAARRKSALEKPGAIKDSFL
ncbi:hypothetical protein J4Q44_G00178390 [Coregonus suidteri]|uniref:SAM domain-containing protein n=1 Tax=Coregonus suidteri TaxID=861788 RepID=A0AAN8LTW8_9TELE